MRGGEKDRLGKREGEDTGCAARVFIIVEQGVLLVVIVMGTARQHLHCVGGLWAGCLLRLE